MIPGLHDSGAGIGGGAGGASGTIEIHGGAVLAKSSKAAGIGAGGTNPKNNFTVYTSSEQARVELRRCRDGTKDYSASGKKPGD